MHPSVVASGDGRRYAIPTPFLLVNRTLQPCLICDGSKLITARDKAALGILALPCTRYNAAPAQKSASSNISVSHVRHRRPCILPPWDGWMLFSPPNWRSDSSQARSIAFSCCQRPQNRQLREEGVGTIRCWIT